MISIKHLDKYFNKGKQNEIHVLNDVSLDLPDKGMVAIFGKSGCGKTTLLNAIGGLDSFSSGSLMVEHQEIGNDPDLIRNKYMGYIFQNYNLDYSKSCFDNVADALRICGINDPQILENRVVAALKNVGMEKYVKRTPDTLSGGQQQRIAIARAIVKNPKIILADEPTGNLDESNTVMIMDLLRTIANDHLVILVTHEANLVDYYCDKVIELADGKIVGVKNNDLAGGFSAKDKNAIYLGELEKSVNTNENTEIEYFGNAPTSPIRMRIVNTNGKIYVRFDSENIQILDENAEIKLLDGVFEEKRTTDKNFENVDMSDLPPINSTKFGRLYTMKSSVVSGYKFNFKQNKKGKMLLRRSLSLFAAVLVLMMSTFGTSISQILDARSMYNHNVFYVYTPNGSVSEKLVSAINDKNSGIDAVRLMPYYPDGDEEIKITAGFFETFSNSYYSESFESNCVFLDASLAEKLELVEGKNKYVAGDEIIITTAVADKLLKTSPYEYIEQYGDLIGHVTYGISFDNKNARICGIVKSDETSVYINTNMLAKYVLRSTSLNVLPDTDLGVDLEPGKTMLLLNYVESGVKFPSQGSEMSIHGIKLELESVFRSQDKYSQWLLAKGISKMTQDEFYMALVKEDYPSLAPDSDAYAGKLSEIKEERYIDWLEYYYSDRAEFFEEQLLITQDMDFWLACEKGIELNALVNYEMKDLAYAKKYAQLNGNYPTFSQLKATYNSLSEAVRNDMDQNYERFTDAYNTEPINYFDFVYVVDESDYVVMSMQYGDTDQSVYSNYMYEYYEKDVVYDEYDDYYLSYDFLYSVIHSSDVKKTAEWLSSEFADLETHDPEYMKAILTPNDIFDQIIETSVTEIVSNIVSMVIIFTVLALCMYFIMRSSFMNRIKEIGISRAIGVSKKNLVFKFTIEAVTLATMTVLLGYLATSAFIAISLHISPLISSVFYYPWWYALILLAVLYIMSIVCGILPILGILRKTPSEILAKYDI